MRGPGAGGASAQARSAEVKGYSGFQPRNQGFFSKHFRRISTSLPFTMEKEKTDRGRPQGNKVAQVLNRVWRTILRRQRSFGLLLVIFLSILMFYITREYLPRCRTTSYSSIQHYIGCIVGRRFLEEGANSSSYWPLIKAVVSWSGKALASGPSSAWTVGLGAAFGGGITGMVPRPCVYPAMRLHEAPRPEGMFWKRGTRSDVRKGERIANKSRICDPCACLRRVRFVCYDVSWK